MDNILKIKIATEGEEKGLSTHELRKVLHEMGNVTVPGLNSAELTNMTIDGLHGDYFGALAANTGDPLHAQAPNIPTAFFSSTLAGVFAFSGGLLGPTNASAPGNASAIKAWVNYTNSSGGVFKLPLYQ